MHQVAQKMKQTKAITLFLAIINLLLALIVGLVFLSIMIIKNMDSANQSEAGAEELSLAIESFSPAMIIALGVSVALFWGLTVIFFIYNGRLKKKKRVSSVPYFILILPFVYGLGTLVAGKFTIMDIVMMLFCSLVISLAILSIRNLFKIQDEQSHLSN